MKLRPPAGVIARSIEGKESDVAIPNCFKIGKRINTEGHR